MTFSMPMLSHSGFLGLTLEQNRALSRLTALDVNLIASHDLAEFQRGQALLMSNLGKARLEIAADHLVLVADRVADNLLALDPSSNPERLRVAKIRTVDRIGDCLAPGLIAHAVYAGHQLARNFERPH